MKSLFLSWWRGVGGAGSTRWQHGFRHGMKSPPAPLRSGADIYQLAHYCLEENAICIAIADAHCKNKHRCNISPFPEAAAGNLLGVMFYTTTGKISFQNQFQGEKSSSHELKKAGQDPFMLIFCIGLLRLL